MPKFDNLCSEFLLSLEMVESVKKHRPILRIVQNNDYKVLGTEI